MVVTTCYHYIVRWEYNPTSTTWGPYIVQVLQPMIWQSLFSCGEWYYLRIALTIIPEPQKQKKASIFTTFFSLLLGGSSHLVILVSKSPK